MCFHPYVNVINDIYDTFNFQARASMIYVAAGFPLTQVEELGGINMILRAALQVPEEVEIGALVSTVISVRSFFT